MQYVCLGVGVCTSTWRCINWVCLSLSSPWSHSGQKWLLRLSCYFLTSTTLRWILSPHPPGGRRTPSRLVIHTCNNLSTDAVSPLHCGSFYCNLVFKIWANILQLSESRFRNFRDYACDLFILWFLWLWNWFWLYSSSPKMLQSYCERRCLTRFPHLTGTCCTPWGEVGRRGRRVSYLSFSAEIGAVFLAESSGFKSCWKPFFPVGFSLFGVILWDF